MNYSIVDTKYNKTDDMINNLQSLKGKTKLNIHQIFSKCYDESNNR